MAVTLCAAADLLTVVGLHVRQEFLVRCVPEKYSNKTQNLIGIWIFSPEVAFLAFPEGLLALGAGPFLLRQFGKECAICGFKRWRGSQRAS